MEQKEFVNQIQSCADLFYQNKEQEAYQTLQTLLIPINQVLQNLAASGTGGQEAVRIMKDFLDAFHLRDQLALADILYFGIPEMIGERKDADRRKE